MPPSTLFKPAFSLGRTRFLPLVGFCKVRAVRLIRFVILVAERVNRRAQPSRFFALARLMYFSNSRPVHFVRVAGPRTLTSGLLSHGETNTRKTTHFPLLLTCFFSGF